jgi:hypothetical protein
MNAQAQFRRLLPVTQTLLAIFFGGCGEWLRVQSINNGVGWNSTLIFHTWPWPLKIALILNFPAVLIGGLFAWPGYILSPNAPEYLELLLSIPFVAILWYAIGYWLELKFRATDGCSNLGLWMMIFGFDLICAAGALFPSTSTIPYCGTAVWGAVSLLIAASTIYDRLRSKPFPATKRIS